MWTDEQWKAKWSQAFFECISEELDASGNPMDQWKASGRITKALPNKEDLAWWTEQGLVFAKNYATWRMDNPEYKLWWTPDGIPANELGLFPMFGRYKVKAYIDRVFIRNGELIVVDVKSGAGMPEDILQLAVYAAAIDLTYGVRPNLGAYWDARKGGLVAVEPLEEFTTDLVVGLIEDYMDQAGRMSFLPNPGRHCTWCEVRKTCPWSKAVSRPIRERAA